ncbi:MAG TPA: tripartite tricarboxylate transporter substrate binding protein [Burkholderiales bacterium]|nr:tripartite tricarboxylate transporter substrate binding protein [Burkholderiales bacterium]
MKYRHAAAIAASVALAYPAAALADWPAQPVRIIVPFSTGGGTDIQARLLADAFSRSTGQNFIVDNKPGASGLVGAQLVESAAADGYTVLFTSATIAINPTLYGKRWTVHPLEDLEPVSWITSAPLVLITHPTVPAKTVPELIALAKKQPNYLNNAINTPGSTSHLAAEMLKQKVGIEVTLVPFKGGGPAVRSVVAGETDFLFATGPSAAPFIRSGRVRALAVTTPKRSSAFPDVPTMSTFYPGFEADNWYAMFFRKGTPQEAVTRLSSEIRKALDSPQVKKFMARESLDPVGSTPDELRAQVKREIAKYGNVIRVGQIQLR